MTELGARAQEEREERELRRAEMEAAKASNLVEHEAEIYARPARTWFQTPRQKAALSEAARAAGEGARSEAGTGGGGGSAADVRKRDKEARRQEAKRKRGAEAAAADKRRKGNRLMEVRHAGRGGRRAGLAGRRPSGPAACWQRGGGRQGLCTTLWVSPGPAVVNKRCALRRPYTAAGLALLAVPSCQAWQAVRVVYHWPLCCCLPVPSRSCARWPLRSGPASPPADPAARCCSPASNPGPPVTPCPLQHCHSSHKCVGSEAGNAANLFRAHARAPGQETEAVAGSVRAAKAREAAGRQQGLSKAAAAAAAVGGARKDAKAKKKDAKAKKRKLSGAGCARSPRHALVALFCRRLDSGLGTYCPHNACVVHLRAHQDGEGHHAAWSGVPRSPRRNRGCHLHAKGLIGIHTICACAFRAC